MERVRINIVESLVRMVALIGALVIFFTAFLIIPLVFQTPQIFSSLYSFTYWFIFSGLILILAAVSFFFAPIMIERRFKFKPLCTEYPEVCDLVKELSNIHNITKTPKQYLLDVSEPNSFIFGRHSKDARLVLTRGLIELLEKDELQSVVLHELAHIKNKDMVFMTWGTTFIKSLKYWLVSFIVVYAILEASLGIFDLKGVFSRVTTGSLLFLIPPALSVYSVSRIREYLADAKVAMSGGATSLTSALSKVDRNLVLSSAFKKIFGGSMHLMFVGITPGKGMANLISKHTFSTHPSIIERLKAIRGRKYVMTGKAIYLPSIETSVYAGLIALYFFISLTFSFIPIIDLLGEPFKGNILLSIIYLLVPSSIIIFLNTYTIKYSDLKILDSFDFKKQTSYVASIIGRILVSCLTLSILTLLMGLNFESLILIFVLYSLLSILCSMIYLPAKVLLEKKHQH